ncbi:excinuclease ABC subunit UvrB [Frankia sp. AgKG'84/4]|uniref:excinuclease ABC subunit UvrB n=1 Tax=Frankia sp. AgKG'84/4 TaxID=573490 RepID=UPI00200CA529|nr:excinuclease ABC subunit UvrB [Frankia sp. AgKG'84/4]MCL9794686.1 excinuclease ABC subunit UvrB [Frankia sp. AgKG'84/4]
MTTAFERPTTDLERTRAPFEVISDYAPAGDQPAAIEELARRIGAGESNVVLLGATGTGKSATTAWLVERLQRPTLVMAPNKTLAAQLANEFRELLPNNAVEYFVSYYDYYQPEAYIAQTDTYIEKDSSINEEVERLRHSATMSLLTRRDTIVVASVSCIYGLGTPQEYIDRMVRLRVGDVIERDVLLRRFVDVQYARNDLAFTRGTFRVRGDTVEVFPVYEELAVRVEMFGDEIERLTYLHPLTGEIVREVPEIFVFPATHYVAGPERMERAIAGIEVELAERLAAMERQGKLLEAQRLRMRTTYDIEMMRQVGFCSGIENYSRHIDGREAGTAPHTLLDYFPDDFLLVIDESHVTVPQIGGMYEGDMSRKRNLVEHGFRLPSAMDNRPLRFEEFLQRIGQTVYLSATPGPYELGRADGVVEQIIRPTGLLDPEVILKPTKGQIDDLVHEIRLRAERDERVLVTTLTKKMSEDLTDYLLEHGIRVRYLHSEVDTLRRVELLTELRRGEFDVLVGINLLREGLDLPEVSLVSILDADKEGFLRSDKSLIQTIGRAARNVSGQVHMYADKVTPSMRHAIDETNRRRVKQMAYNAERGLDPQPLRKKVVDILDDMVRESAEGELVGGGGRAQSRGKAPVPGMKSRGGRDDLVGKYAAELAGMPSHELAQLIRQLDDQMHEAARDLKFELAARLRDEIGELKKELRGMGAAGVQ